MSDDDESRVLAFPSRDVLRSRRLHEVRARTENVKRLPMFRLERGAREVESIDLAAYERPLTRGDCLAGPNAARPCPFVSCRHNLYLDVHEVTGSIKLNFPDLAPEDMAAARSCTLDIADVGGATLEVAGDAMNVSRERVRQVEETAFKRMKLRGGRALAEHADGDGLRPAMRVEGGVSRQELEPPTETAEEGESEERRIEHDQQLAAEWASRVLLRVVVAGERLRDAIRNTSTDIEDSIVEGSVDARGSTPPGSSAPALPPPSEMKAKARNGMGQKEKALELIDARGPMTRSELAEAMGLAPNNVDTLLYVGKKRGIFARVGDGKWARADGSTRTEEPASTPRAKSKPRAPTAPKVRASKPADGSGDPLIVDLTARAEVLEAKARRIRDLIADLQATG